MAQRIEVGSAEFQMLMGLDKFRAQVEKEAPEIAARGAAKVAKELDAGAKKGADAVARETKRGEDARERELKRGADVAAREAKRASDAQIKEAQRGASQTKQALAQGLAIGAGAVGASTGIGAVVQGIQAIGEATKDAAQSQFALGKAFGANSDAMKQSADDLADSLGGQRSEFEKATIATATLTKNYGLSAAQAQNVVKIGTDLAAVYGLDVVDATTRVTSAIRGEAEASEVLGLSLQSDAVKGLAAMTDAQRKNYETLDPATKAQILYNAVIDQSGKATGSAAERANSAIGSFDKFGKSMSNLGAAIGTAVLPEAQHFVDFLTNIIKLLPEAAKALDDFNKSAAGSGKADPRLDANTNFFDRFFPVGGGVKDTAADLVARARGQQLPSDILAAQERERAGQAATATAARPANDPAEAIKQAANARTAFQNEAKKQIEELDKIEKDRISGNLKNLKDAEQESIAAINTRKDAAIAAADAERDANLAGAAASRDAAIQALEQQQAARARVRVQQDRALSDQRQAEDRALSSARQGEDRGLSSAREQEDRAREASNARQLDALERQKDAAVSGQEAVIEGIDRKRDAALAAIDDERDAEDKRHTEALDNLQEEQDARLGILDDQLDALRAQEQAERRKESVRQANQSLSDAKRGISDASREASRDKRDAQERLNAALLKGDPRAIRDAREGLSDASRSSSRSMESAQRALADARRSISREANDFAREDRRKEIEDQKDAIRKEIAERKKAEDEKNAAIKAGLSDRKDATQLAANDEIEAARKTKDAIVQSYADRADAIKREQQTRAQAIADQRGAEDQAIADRRAAEDQALADQRTAQDRAIADQRAAEDAAQAAALAAVQAAYANQTRAIQAEYDRQRLAAQQSADAQIKETQRTFEAAALKMRQQQNDWQLLTQIALQDIGSIGQAMVNAIFGPQVQQAFRNLQTQFQSIPNPQGGFGSTPYGPSAPGGGATQQQTTPSTLNANRTGFSTTTSTSTAAKIPGINDVENYLLSVGFQRGSDEFIRESASLWDELHRTTNRLTVPTNWNVPITGFAGGGFITEPTLLSSKRTGKVYGQMAEGGRGEWIVPQDKMGGRGAMHATVTVNDHRTDVNAGPNWAEAAPQIAEYVTGLIAYAQSVMPDPSNPNLPGAESVW